MSASVLGSPHMITKNLRNEPDVDPEQVPSILAAMGFNGIKAGDVRCNERIHFATVYKCGQLAVKINANKRYQMQLLYPNKLASDTIGRAVRPNSKVVHVLDYDYKKRTPYEVLVMEQLPGVPAHDDLNLMKIDDIKSLFGEVCVEARHMMDYTFPTFGAISEFGDLGPMSFENCKDFLVAMMRYSNAKSFETQPDLIDPHILRRLEDYFMKHVSVFENEKACFAHDDMIWFNCLHEGPKLTGLVDFDLDLKLPPCQILHWILLALHHPASGPLDSDNVFFPNLKHMHLCHELLPNARKAFPDLFADPLLVRKLNLLRIAMRVRLHSLPMPHVADQMVRLLDTEIPDTDALLDDSFFGKLLHEDGCSL